MAYQPAFIIDSIGEKQAAATPEALEDMGHLLWALVNINMGKLRRYPDEFPPLYEAGIVYAEPNIVRCEGIDDNWIDIVTLYRLGRGTCKELAAARVAELRVRWGVDAVPFVTMDPMPDGIPDQFHVMVEWPNRGPFASSVQRREFDAPGGGTVLRNVECPSTVLGMGRVGDAAKVRRIA